MQTSVSSAGTTTVRTESTRVVIGGTRAFTVLLLGGAVQPLVGTAQPQLGYVWLLLVALGAFAVAGWSAAPGGPGQVLRGATAALLGYSLVVPVVAMAGAFNLLQAAITTLLALAVGSAVATLTRRGRTSR